MANSIAKQMADMAKWKGFTNPIVVVVASDSEVVVTVRGAFAPNTRERSDRASRGRYQRILGKRVNHCYTRLPKPSCLGRFRFG